MNESPQDPNLDAAIEGLRETLTSKPASTPAAVPTGLRRPDAPTAPEEAK